MHLFAMAFSLMLSVIFAFPEQDGIKSHLKMS